MTVKSLLLAILEEQHAIRMLMEQQTAVIRSEEIRKLATASPEERRANNKAVLARAKAKQGPKRRLEKVERHG